MYRTDNPLADFERHDREQAKWLRSRPKCFACGEPIQEEQAYSICGELYCEDCISDSKIYID